GSNTAVKDVTIPACVAYIGENAFYSKTVLYVYENSQTSAQLVGREYSVVYLKMSFVSGDVNADGSFDIADVVMMQKWILNIGSLVDWKAGDLYEDQMINVLDLCIMKQKLFENI
ncbi:MAG: dockerin type I repeat-containing protein, partial [Oscillospiraceae bacterium]|nr:dockerin type I repeat-containing protein [Oscillospiraceae bacterium]